MENENSVSNSKSRSSTSNLQSLIERINDELEHLNQCIQDAKSFEYPDEKVGKLAKKLLNKYSHSIVQIDNSSLSASKSIWIYSKDFIDLSTYEEELTASSITLSHVDFSVLLDKIKKNIRDEILVFVVKSLYSINSAIDFKYSFCLLDIITRDFTFDETSQKLQAQFELVLDVR